MKRKIVFIDTYNCKFSEMPFPEEHTLEFIQGLVGGRIEAVHLDENNTIYVNEEGLFNSSLAGFVWNGTPYMGNGVIVGFDPKVGENHGTDWNDYQAAKQIRLLSREEADDFRKMLG